MERVGRFSDRRMPRVPLESASALNSSYSALICIITVVKNIENVAKLWKHWQTWMPWWTGFFSLPPDLRQYIAIRWMVAERQKHHDSIGKETYLITLSSSSSMSCLMLLTQVLAADLSSFIWFQPVSSKCLNIFACGVFGFPARKYHRISQNIYLPAGKYLWIPCLIMIFLQENILEHLWIACLICGVPAGEYLWISKE